MRSRWLRVLMYLALFWLVSTLLAALFSAGNFDVSEKILVIPVKGSITSSDSGGSLRGGVSSVDLIGDIDAALKDPLVKGIILDIDSGGGEVVPSKQIADKVKSAGKPVVSLVGGMAASGAYWIASASDSIVADPLSVTGSIGVIGSYLDFDGLMEDYGINYNRLISGKYKDTGSPFKRLESEEKDILQDKLDIIHDYFITSVAENRGIEKSKVREVADGFFMLGLEAKSVGLVDHLGGIGLALNLTRNMTASPDAKLVYLKRERDLFDTLSFLGMDAFYNMGLGISNGLITSRASGSIRFDA